MKKGGKLKEVCLRNFTLMNQFPVFVKIPETPVGWMATINARKTHSFPVQTETVIPASGPLSLSSYSTPVMGMSQTH